MPKLVQAKAWVETRGAFVCPSCQYETPLYDDETYEAECLHCGQMCELDYEQGDDHES